MPSSLQGRAGTENPVDFRSPASATAMDGIGRTFERSRKRSAEGIHGVSRKAVPRPAPLWFRLRRVGVFNRICGCPLFDSACGLGGNIPVTSSAHGSKPAGCLSAGGHSETH